MDKTLVIVLSETRASELTFENFKKNVIDELNADLCVCIGITSNYDFNNSFYKLAKYKFIYNEPDDFGDAFDYASNIINKEKNINNNLSLHWRKFLEIKDQFLGGIKDDYNQHEGSAGILIFFRWFLLKNLIENNLINKYDRFIITRSDFIYQLPHPKLEIMNKKNIWIPNCEYYGGYTDRHAVLSQVNIESYLNILNNLVLRSNEYYSKMKNKSNWNLEKVIKFHLEQNNVIHLVKEFPYIMYAVRNINGTTRWSKGKFSGKLGYFIKYKSEYDKSNFYYKEFRNSHLTINDFYKKYII